MPNAYGCVVIKFCHHFNICFLSKKTYIMENKGTSKSWVLGGYSRFGFNLVSLYLSMR